MIAEILFYLFFFLKQFYLFPSGSIGIADICLFSAFIGLAVEELWQKHKIDWKKEDFLFYLFLLSVIVINALYAYVYNDSSYIKYSFFWIYNGCAIWVFRTFAERDDAEAFFRRLSYLAKLNILIQCTIFAFGWGRIFVEPWGALRYMGTFNDPNQLAFFLFMMLLFLYLYACRFGDRTFGAFYVLTSVLILQSKSTGIFLGMIVLTIMISIAGVAKLYRNKRYGKKIWLGSIVAVVLVSVGLLILIWPSSDFDVKNVEYNMLTRIQEKLWKLSNGGFSGMIMDRGMEKVLLYPQYILYGAGEGGFERFVLASQVNEIHCCLLSLMFCYGFFPTIVLMIWLIQNIQKNTTWMWCAIIALLVESFFLINYRQPMFWMILLYAGVTEHIKSPVKKS